MGCCLQDDAICFSRQDDYLIPFQRFADDLRLVQFYVQKPAKLTLAVNKFLPYIDLRFSFFTGEAPRVALKVCVDFFPSSAKVACVDGRKGWHNNTEPVQSRLSDQLDGATC